MKCYDIDVIPPPAHTPPKPNTPMQSLAPRLLPALNQHFTQAIYFHLFVFSHTSFTALSPSSLLSSPPESFPHCIQYVLDVGFAGYRARKREESAVVSHLITAGVMTVEFCEDADTKIYRCIFNTAISSSVQYFQSKENQV